MRFTVIRFADDVVSLKWEERIGDASDKHDWSCDEPPTPAFKAALAAFSTFVVDLVAAPEAWVEGLEIRQLSLKEEEKGGRGLVVTALRKCERAKNRTLLLNTPYLAEAPKDYNGPMAGYLTATVLELIEEAEAEAELYRLGERGEQTSLDLEDSENAKNVNERMASAEIDSTKKPRRGKKNPNAGKPEVHQVQNPDATEPPMTDDEMRQLLLSVERDVPIDAFPALIRSERLAVEGWARAQQRRLIGALHAGEVVPEEPAWVKANATLPLVESGR